MCLVMGEDAMCPDGPIRNRGVKDVQGGLGDGALGRVVDAERDGEREREVNRLVGGAVLEIEGVGERDVGRRECWARAIAGGDLGWSCRRCRQTLRLLRPECTPLA